MVPGVLLTIFVFKGNVVSVWLFLSCYVILESMMMFWRFRSGHWQKINMIERRQFGNKVPVSRNEPAI
jgi:Na+-driven multidrug efflux pump